MSLPSTGATNWGVPLNNYIVNVVLAQANTATSAITNHQTASDPHGDRAYALGLVAPLTSGVNGPNGFLQLNGAGRIPSNVLPTGGGTTSTFDVVADYNAPTNGTAASTAIQNALNAAGAIGGGHVWIGDGSFGIDLPLYVPSNVWLHLSPGATMTRIVNSGLGVAPAYMLANFNGSTSSSGSSNILVEGGAWVFDSQTATGVPMAFVGGTGILVRNTSVRTLAQNPAVLFAGCTGCATKGVTYLATSPASARSAYSSSPPAVRIENAASAVISGLNAAMYTNAPCASIYVEDCYISGATNSDGTGLYTVFGGLAGTTAAVSGSFHTGIMVTGNNCIALPYNGTYPGNWQTCTIAGNQFGLNNGQDATPTWNPSAPGYTNLIIDNNLSTIASANPKAYYTSNSGGRTGTSLSIDGTLQVTVVANAVYEVRASIAFDSGSSAIKYDWSLPSGQFNYTSSRVDGTNFYVNGYAIVNNINAGSPDTALANANGGIQITGLLQVSSTGGTFGLEWCQLNNAPGFPIVLLAGSYLYLTRLA